MKFQKICILGLGYIGLPYAATFAAHGIKVHGVDISPRVIESLQAGKIHIHEPGLQDVLDEALRVGNLTVSSQPVEADAFIISVPTPFQHDKFGEHNGIRFKLADMRAVTSATEAILPVLRKGNLVIIESTSPPLTTVELVAPILARSNLQAGADFHLCYSPERVLPGNILHELVNNARIIGGITPESARAARDLYATFVKGEIHETDATTAEMVKIMENTTRDVNIAIANEFARLAEKFGVDVWEAIRLANLHPRIDILNPGPGVGGHCISVDPWFLVEAAPEFSSLIYQARKVNDEQPKFVVEKVKQSVCPAAVPAAREPAESILKNKKIAALGLALQTRRGRPARKPRRRSDPSPPKRRSHRPRMGAVRAERKTRRRINMASDFDSAIQDADAILLLVSHSQFRTLNPTSIATKTKARIAIDTVNAWNRKDWQSAGFSLHRLGDAKSPISSL
ncbi:MAG: nucleotide sugar dehydrogenase [Anaerolineales bacterium]